MKKYFIMAAAAMMVAINLSAQTKRSDDFRAKYQLKEVVVMSRHNIRSPLTSGGAVYKRLSGRRRRASCHCVVVYWRRRWASFSESGW